MNIGELVGFIDLDDKGFGSGLAGAFGKLKDFGGKTGMILGGLGATGAVAFGAGLSGAMDAEAATAKLAAQLGAVGTEAGDLGHLAGSVYSHGFGDSMEQVNTAIKGVVNDIGAIGDADGMDRVTGKVLNLSKTFDQDLGGTTRAVGQLMKTGLAANADEALDIVTAGFTSGIDKAGDLLDTISEYSTQFRKLGLDGQTSMGLLSQGLQAGARDADTVADALKEFSIRAIDGSKATGEGFKALGLDGEQMAAQIAGGGKGASDGLQLVLDKLRGMQDPVEQQAAAVALFGTKAEDLGASLFALDPSHATQAIMDVGGAADQMGKTLNDTASGNLETFKRQVSTAFVEWIGGKALPVARELTSWLVSNFGPAVSMVAGYVSGTLVPALSSMAKWMSDNSTPLLIIAGLIAAVFLPGLIALGVTSTITGVKVAAAWVMQQAAAISAAVVHSGQVLAMVGGWVIMGTQSLIQAARMAAAWLIAMGPVGLIIALVVGLVALIIANWDTITSATAAAWQWLSDIVSGAVDWVVGFVRDHWRLLLMIIMGPLGMIIVFVVDHWSQIKALFAAGVDTVIGIFGWFGRLPGMIGGWFGSVYDAATGKLGELIGWVQGIPGRILDALGNLGSMLYNSGASMLRGLIDGFMSMVNTVKDKVSGALRSIRDLFPFSPAKEGPFSGTGWVSYSGASIANALAAGIVSGTGAVLNATEGLMSAAHGSLTPSYGGGVGSAFAGAAGSGGRAPVNIQNFHPPAGASPHQVAAELDWLSKAGG